VRRVAVAALLCLALVLTGCTFHRPVLTDPGPDVSGGGGSIDWRSCLSEAQKSYPKLPSAYTVQCGNVTVPQDWRTAKDGKATDGKTFQIAVMRIRSNKQHDRIGSLLTNPGGPGGSGIDFLPYLSSQVPVLMDRFDLIGFDPRGVGQSASVKCISDSDLDANFGYEPDPTSDAAYQGAIDLNKHIANGCGTKFGSTLDLFATEQAAHDMDAIRSALGDQKLNYLGFSYGTLLGAVYAELFPTTIRAMVLDGAVDPTESPVESTEGQAMGFERAFANFDAWCKANASQCPIAPDARGAVNAAIASARTNPVKYSDGRSATSGWVFLSVVSTLYNSANWTYLAQAIANLKKGDARLVFALADNYGERDENGHYSSLFDANSAVNCSDSAKYPTVDQVRTLQSEWRAKYPLFGAPLALGLLGCAVWPAKHDPYPVGKAKGAPPIVVVGTKGDPATPYESTAKLADMLGTGVVLTSEGEGHTAYGSPGSTACIRTAVESYLIDLKVPAKGTTCPAK
jgi:pimeloyl-ACP methyl ester carboxylesterase